jgi:hypothetical protein
MATEYAAVVDAVTWTAWDDKSRQFVHHTLHRGETAEVPDEHVARINQIQDKEIREHVAGRVVDHRAGHPRLVPADQYDEYVSSVTTATLPENQFTDEQIRSWGADDTIAYLNRVPALADRVLALEEDRKPKRRAVIAHAERVKAAQDGDDVSLGGDLVRPDDQTA